MTIAQHPQPAGLQKLLDQDADLVDRIFGYLLEQMPELAQAAERLDAVQRNVRQEFGGQEVYVASQTTADRAQLVQQVLHMFNGRNASEVARKLHISRATVYRYLKQAADSKPVSAFPRTETPPQVACGNEHAH